MAENTSWLHWGIRGLWWSASLPWAHFNRSWIPRIAGGWFLTPKIIWTFQLKMLLVGNWIWVKIRGLPEEDSPERQASTASCNFWMDWSYWVCETRTARTKSPCNWDLFSSSNGKKISRSGFKLDANTSWKRFGMKHPVQGRNSDSSR